MKMQHKTSHCFALFVALWIMPAMTCNAQKDTPPVDSAAEIHLQLDASEIQPLGGPQDGLRVFRQHMAAGEKVTFLGVSTTQVPQVLQQHLDLKPGFGLLIESIAPDSPAARADLQPHDILQKFEDQWLVNDDQLRTLVRSQKAGDVITITFLRKGEPQSVAVTLVEQVQPAEVAIRFMVPQGGIHSMPAVVVPQVLTTSSLHRQLAAAQWRARLAHQPPIADRQMLVRRLYLDLLGVPPTTEEIRTFESDVSEDAVEKLIDSLLQRPSGAGRGDVLQRDLRLAATGVQPAPDVMLNYTDNVHILRLEGDGKDMVLYVLSRDGEKLHEYSELPLAEVDVPDVIRPKLHRIQNQTGFVILKDAADSKDSKKP